MKKKLVSMLLCAAMTVAMVSGCGSKTEDAAPEAAEQMRVTAQDLKELGIIEKVIPEPQPANPQNAAKIAGAMQEEIRRFLHQYLPIEGETLAKQRYERFLNM